jgi:hypothetical protein
VIVPDYVEPIEAWRVWLVDYEFRLRSVLFDAVWPPEEALVATCRHRRRSWRPPWREVKVEHGAPGDDCGCGIYGADREKVTQSYGRLALPSWAIARVVGRVALWGQVVECERGWRASHAYPSRLCAPVLVPFRRRRRGAETSGQIAHALGAYGVPVERADHGWVGVGANRGGRGGLMRPTGGV